LKQVYSTKLKSVHLEDNKHVIFTKWRDFNGELQYDVSDLPYSPKPALSPGCITVYSNMVKLSIGEMQPPHLHNIKRGEIIPEFVGKKRKRMIDAINSWRIPMINVMFITLTYPKDYPKSWKEWKNDLKIYKEHLQREYPQAQGFWKLELQRRGAPHFHLVCDLAQKISLADFRAWNDELWANIAHYMDTHAGVYACTVKKMHTVREALNYAAKYQTKETYAPVDGDGVVYTAQQLGDTVGRLWGRIGKPDCAPSEQIQVRREWALNAKHIFADVLRIYNQHKYADYLDRQGAHNSLTLYGVGDCPLSDPYHNAPRPPPIGVMLHKILQRDRAYNVYKTPKGYTVT